MAMNQSTARSAGCQVVEDGTKPFYRICRRELRLSNRGLALCQVVEKLRVVVFGEHPDDPESGMKRGRAE
jgi:hypothetical protein